MRISAKRVNLGKNMILRNKTRSSVKKIIKKTRKIIKNKTNKRKTKKMKKKKHKKVKHKKVKHKKVKHKKVKHKTTRKIRLMSHIGRRRTYHGGAIIPMPTAESRIGQGSYGIVYVPNASQPGWVAKLHEEEVGTGGCKHLLNEHARHQQALELLKSCSKQFRDINLKIPKLQQFQYLTQSTNPRNFETTTQPNPNITGCVYKMSRIWEPSENQIKSIIKDNIYYSQGAQKPPAFLFLSYNRYPPPHKSTNTVEISMLKNSYFASPTKISSSIIEDKFIGFIEPRAHNDRYYVFGWGYSMMLFYFYCAQNNLILRDSEFALGRFTPTNEKTLDLFCYDFNQCREAINTLDTAKQYLHLSGMKIGNAPGEDESETWKFMPIPTTSPLFFVTLVNMIFTHKASDAIFKNYIKGVVDQILLWLVDVKRGTGWKFSPTSTLTSTINNSISKLFETHNIQNHYYFSIRSAYYNTLDDGHVFKAAQEWTNNTDELEGEGIYPNLRRIGVGKSHMMNYREARAKKCKFGLNNLETNFPELNNEKIYFYTTNEREYQKICRELISTINREPTFLVNIKLDIEMQKTIIKKMVINGFIVTKYIKKESEVVSLLNIPVISPTSNNPPTTAHEQHGETKEQVAPVGAGQNKIGGFDKMIEMLDIKYIPIKMAAAEQERRLIEEQEAGEKEVKGNGSAFSLFPENDY